MQKQKYVYSFFSFFKKIVVNAHPTLFTRIGLNGQGEPAQSVDDSETFTLEVEHTADIEREKREMVVPYDIFNDRLFRIRLLRDSQHYYLFIDTHHIISDGSTLRLLLSDIATAYGGGMLEPEAVTMMDVAKDEAERRQTPAFEEARQWYARNFDCGDTFSQLIPDRERSDSSQFFERSSQASRARSTVHSYSLKLIRMKQSRQRLAYCQRRWRSVWRRLTPTARSTAYSRAHSSPPYMPI